MVLDKPSQRICSIYILNPPLTLATYVPYVRSHSKWFLQNNWEGGGVVVYYIEKFAKKEEENADVEIIIGTSSTHM